MMKIDGHPVVFIIADRSARVALALQGKKTYLKKQEANYQKI